MSLEVQLEYTKKPKGVRNFLFCCTCLSFLSLWTYTILLCFYVVDFTSGYFEDNYTENQELVGSMPFVLTFALLYQIIITLTCLAVCFENSCLILLTFVGSLFFLGWEVWRLGFELQGGGPYEEYGIAVGCYGSPLGIERFDNREELCAFITLFRVFTLIGISVSLVLLPCLGKYYLKW